MKKILLTIVLFLTFFITFSYAEGVDTVFMLFTSDDCTHCDDVKDAIVANGLEEKINIEYYEISIDENRALFDEKVAICELTGSDIAVPMMFFDETCLVSSQLVIEQLDEAAGVETEPESETIISGVEDNSEEASQDEVLELPDKEDSEISSTTNPTQTLNNALYGEDIQTQPISFWKFITILFPISSFIGIAYLLINKFKL